MHLEYIVPFLLLLEIFLIKKYDKKQAVEMVSEFVVKFPGRCMICSYHDFGLNNGFKVEPLQPHNCIEGNTK